jgi:hypothetical protein
MSLLPTGVQRPPSKGGVINPSDFIPGDAAHQSQVSFDQVSAKMSRHIMISTIFEKNRASETSQANEWQVGAKFYD